ncbi:MAG: cell division protein SepF [Leucobacter sp.]|nr:cell division protein SepF [Leucobacter sp.]
MGNPLKKTMVFLGLAEEELDEHGTPTDVARPEQEQPSTAAAKPVQRAQVTPLRKVAPVRHTPATAMNEILTVHPTAYRDAAVVAESFRDGVPVIMNLSRMDDSEAKRLIDFASGLAMGLRGRIERVTSKVFLLSPEHIATSNDEQDQPAAGEATSFFAATS